MAVAKEVKLVFVGNAGVGKTSILSAYTDRVYESQYLLTIGVDYKQRRVTLEDGSIVKLQMWDTAGQERFRSLTINYYRGAHIVILVYDITNMKSFNDLKEWKQLVEFQNPEAKYWVVGNKADKSIHREVPEEIVRTWAESIQALWTEVSAKSFLQIEPLFQEIAAVCVNPDPSPQNITLALTPLKTSWIHRFC
jgi:Ras-related protein Rab-1A